MNFISLTSDSLSVIHDLAHEIWPITYQTILKKEQIEYMLAEIYSLPSLEKQREEGQHFVLVQNEDGEIFGFLAYSSVSATHCKINKLYLRGSARGKGVGKQMIDWVEEKAHELGHSVLTLNVHRENVAVQFYKKMKFEVSEVIDIPFGEYWLTDYVMEKKA